MRLARKLGMISYRSGEEWAERFGRERAPDFAEQDTPFGIDFEVESYLKVTRIDSSAPLMPIVISICHGQWIFDGLDHGGSLAASFSDLQLESALVIGVRTDALFPLSQQQELADALGEKVPMSPRAAG